MTSSFEPKFLLNNFDKENIDSLCKKSKDSSSLFRLLYIFKENIENGKMYDIPYWFFLENSSYRHFQDFCEWQEILFDDCYLEDVIEDPEERKRISDEYNDYMSENRENNLLYQFNEKINDEWLELIKGSVPEKNGLLVKYLFDEEFDSNKFLKSIEYIRTNLLPYMDAIDYGDDTGWVEYKRWGIEKSMLMEKDISINEISSKPLKVILRIKKIRDEYNVMNLFEFNSFLTDEDNNPYVYMKGYLSGLIWDGHYPEISQRDFFNVMDAKSAFLHEAAVNMIKEADDDGLDLVDAYFYGMGDDVENNDPCVLHCQNWEVSDGYRGKGIGIKLFEETIDLIQSNEDYSNENDFFEFPYHNVSAITFVNYPFPSPDMDSSKNEHEWRLDKVNLLKYIEKSELSKKMVIYEEKPYNFHEEMMAVAKFNI